MRTKSDAPASRNSASAIRGDDERVVDAALAPAARRARRVAQRIDQPPARRLNRGAPARTRRSVTMATAIA